MRKFYVRKLEERIPTFFDTPMVVEKRGGRLYIGGKAVTQTDVDLMLADRHVIKGCPEMILIEEGEDNDETTKDAVGDSNGL